MLKKIAAALVALVAVVAVTLTASDALALAYPLSRLYAVTASVGTTAEKVTSDFTGSPTTGWKSCTIWNNSATILYVGGDDVSSTKGFPICTDTASCPKSFVSVDAQSAHYLSASGTLTPVNLCGR